MNEKNNWLVDQVEKHWFAGLLGLILIWSNFNDADAATARELKQLNQQIADVQEKLRDRRSFMGCSVRSLDKISEKMGIELPCELNLPE